MDEKNKCTPCDIEDYNYYVATNVDSTMDDYFEKSGQLDSDTLKYLDSIDNVQILDSNLDDSVLDSIMDICTEIDNYKTIKNEPLSYSYLISFINDFNDFIETRFYNFDVNVTEEMISAFDCSEYEVVVNNKCSDRRYQIVIMTVRKFSMDDFNYNIIHGNKTFIVDGKLYDTLSDVSTDASLTLFAVSKKNSSSEIYFYTDIS